MQLKPMPHYFIIKINIEEQKQRREKIGSLYVHTSHVFMVRNMQQGEVVTIGHVAAKQFPEVEIGSTILIHHFVEGDSSDKSNLIHTDGTFNYYNVTASNFNGHRNETYGILKDNEIIPHPDFVFAEIPCKAKEISAEEFIEKNTKQVGSLILFTNWEEKREDKEAKATQLTEEIKRQSQGKSMSESTKHGLEEKQLEAEKLTASINKQKYIPLKLAFAHPSLKAKEEIYSLNIGSGMELEVEGKTYFVISSKYVAATA